MRRHPKKRAGSSPSFGWIYCMRTRYRPPGNCSLERYTGSLGRTAGAMPATRTSWTCWGAVRQLSVTYSKPWRTWDRSGWSPGPAGKAPAARSGGSSVAGNWPLRRPRRYQQKLRVPREGTRRNLRGVPAETCGSTSISNYNNTPYSPPKGDDPDLMRSFDLFWDKYPKKVKKKKARELWQKLRPDAALASVILAALERQKCSDRWQRDGGQYIPDPTTWLNGRRWEDELFPAEPERPTPPDDARRGRCL